MRQTGVQPSRAEQLSLLGPTRGGMLPASRVGRALHVPGLLPAWAFKHVAVLPVSTVLTQRWIRGSSPAGSARSSLSWASQWACCQPSRPRLRSAPPPSPATSPTPRVGSRAGFLCGGHLWAAVVQRTAALACDATFTTGGWGGVGFLGGSGSGSGLGLLCGGLAALPCCPAAPLPCGGLHGPGPTTHCSVS